MSFVASVIKFGVAYRVFVKKIILYKWIDSTKNYHTVIKSPVTASNLTGLPAYFVQFN